jgi:hypothetical protein
LRSKSSDGDGITDDLDVDSDNDGYLIVLRLKENLTLFTDANHDGLYDAFGLVD